LLDPNQRLTPVGGEFSLRYHKKKFGTRPNSLAGKLHLVRSGRDALRAALSYFPNKSRIFVSAYTCDSVFAALSMVPRVEVIVVDIDDSMYPSAAVLSAIVGSATKDFSTDIYLLGSVFGIEYPSSLLHFLEQFRDKNGTVIEDITHRIDLDSPPERDAWFCSIRKWFGTPGLGAFSVSLTANKLGSDNLFHSRVDHLRLRNAGMRLLGYKRLQQFFRRPLIEYLRWTDRRLGLHRKISTPNLADVAAFGSIDWNSLLKTRHENKKALELLLEDVGGIRLVNSSTNADGSFPLTIWVDKDRDGLRSHLRAANIFAPVLWPIAGSPDQNSARAKVASEHILTLSLDQRYGINEVNRCADLVKDFLAGSSNE